MPDLARLPGPIRQLARRLRLRDRLGRCANHPSERDGKRYESENGRKNASVACQRRSHRREGSALGKSDDEDGREISRKKTGPADRDPRARSY
jgi:hypothetical protein